jgi:hypothetical protein
MSEYNLQRMCDEANELLLCNSYNIKPRKQLTEMWCYVRHIIIELDKQGYVVDQYETIKDILKEIHGELRP